MVRNISKVVLVFAVLFSAASISAKSYVFGSLGTQFDLGQLGGTITKDGLDASNNFDVAPSSANANAGVSPRRAIIPENRLITLQHTTNGLISAKTSGAMTGGVISVGYEKDFGKAFFWRISGNYTRKIMGGDTTAKFAGYEYYNIHWDYNAIQIPVNVGIKLSVSEDAAIYIGAGIHYFKGGWSLAGSNHAEDVHQYLVTTLGAGNTITNLVADGTSPQANWENTRFSVAGFAPNWLIGAQARLTDKGHFFMEAETLYSFQYGVGHTHSLGGIISLAPTPAYPIVLGGTQYRFGYKLEI
ncbi:hypothetical protein LEP1GSC047_3471 [Leptospira inadai serovar Lyme str. 10]|uniref:Porin OmpL1 n=3 Tax=Pseudomonadati TaxID=3379134 RepID=V6HCR3_9LEPT|nr:porin OmpL1 [Leptospira inadai]EQA37477.1 hypothetical protein LEP1GSC047_3471 [Leptospira inadai serovar Lyme str. 10]PNV74690.1 porin OmpL1 [Leptospira inadai serovar Lyme]